MEIDDRAGGTMEPFSYDMLPTLLCVKFDHASFNTWKGTENLNAKYDISSKFRTVTQRSKESKDLIDKEKKFYKDVCEKRKWLKSHMLRKLSAEEKEQLKKAIK
eukprot:7773969-Ditylum_brightwellii.AAC.1